MESEKLPQAIKNVRKHELHGFVYDLLLPCGHTVTLREQNGNDDDIISSFNKGEIESTSFNRFVASLVVAHNFFPTPEGKIQSLSLNDVLNIPLRSKYFMILASRIYSLGPNLLFEWDWKDGNPPVPYEDDLTQYIWDYTEPFPEIEEETYNKERIKPYNLLRNSDSGEIDFFRYLTLKSGKNIRFNLLDGHGENYLLKLPMDKRTANAVIKARNLYLLIEEKGDYVKVQNFKSFSTRDMIEIRAFVDREDSVFEGLTEIENPNNGEIQNLPLLHVPDFFFPREI